MYSLISLFMICDILYTDTDTKARYNTQLQYLLNSSWLFQITSNPNIKTHPDTVKRDIWPIYDFLWQ